jgi:archaemetzincin
MVGIKGIFRLLQWPTFFLLLMVVSLSACKKQVKTLPTVSAVINNQLPAKKNQVKIIRIAIAPYDSIDSVSVCLIASEFERFYQNVKTSILPTAMMDDSLLAYSKTRYNANKILTHLSLIKPEETPYILAITDRKIAACGDSIHESGVAGLGNRPGNCCVVSTAALKNKLKDQEQFSQRLVKACFHEMGHNFGLSHCKKNKKCLMRDAAGTIVTLDEEDIFLCRNCVELLKKKGINVKTKTHPT